MRYFYIFIFLCSSAFAKDYSVTTLQDVRSFSMPGYDMSTYQMHMKNGYFNYLDSQGMGTLIPFFSSWFRKGTKLNYTGYTQTRKDRRGVLRKYHRVQSGNSVGWVSENTVSPVSPAIENAPSIRPQQTPNDVIRANREKQQIVPYRKSFVKSTIEGWSFKDSACHTPPMIIGESMDCSEPGRQKNDPFLSSILNSNCEDNADFNHVCDEQGLHRKSASILPLSKHNEIPIQCVNEAMLAGENIRPNERLHCRDSEQRGQRSKPACVSEGLVRKLHWEVNAAIQCVSSSGDALDSTEVFKIINHESGFQHDVSYNGGRGLMQLTTPGAKDMTPHVDSDGNVIDRSKGHPSYMIWLSIKDNPECESYREIISKGEERTRKGFIKPCQFLNIQDGVKRSLIHGLTLHKSYNDRAKQELDKDDFTSEEEYQEALLVASRLLYNQGPGPFLSANSTVKKKNGKLTAEQYEKYLQSEVGAFIGDRNYSYSSKVDKDYLVVSVDSIVRSNRDAIVAQVNQQLGSKKLTSDQAVELFKKAASSGKQDFDKYLEGLLAGTEANAQEIKKMISDHLSEESRLKSMSNKSLESYLGGQRVC